MIKQSVEKESQKTGAPLSLDEYEFVVLDTWKRAGKEYYAHLLECNFDSKKLTAEVLSLIIFQYSFGIQLSAKIISEQVPSILFWDEPPNVPPFTYRECAMVRQACLRLDKELKEAINLKEMEQCAREAFQKCEKRSHPGEDTLEDVKFPLAKRQALENGDNVVTIIDIDSRKMKPYVHHYKDKLRSKTDKWWTEHEFFYDIQVDAETNQLYVQCDHCSVSIRYTLFDMHLAACPTHNRSWCAFYCPSCRGLYKKLAQKAPAKIAQGEVCACCFTGLESSDSDDVVLKLDFKVSKKESMVIPLCEDCAKQNYVKLQLRRGALKHKVLRRLLQMRKSLKTKMAPGPKIQAPN